MTVSNQKATANYVPAAAVIRKGVIALSGFIGRKAARRRSFKSDVKAPGLTGEGHWKLEDWSAEEESGIPRVAVKCGDMWRGTPVAKATLWSVTDKLRRESVGSKQD